MNTRDDEQREFLVPAKRTLFGLLLIAILCAACNYPTATQTADGSGQTAENGISSEGTAQPTNRAAPALLPHSLYFLSSRSGRQQVWRLDADGIGLHQITNESLDVDGYDVSRTDGTVAYVTDNQLYLINSDGSQRRLLVDNSAADPDAEDFFYPQAISAPRFSPNGETLAYAQNGVWVFAVATNQAAQLLTNQLEIFDDGSAPANELYFPEQWAPDNTQLVISVAQGEGGTLAVLDTGREAMLTRFESLGVFCCQTAWAPDSGSVLVASPYLGLVDAGLWRYDARSGAQTTLLETVSADLYQFAGWPLQAANGDLYYFYTSSTDIPEGDQPMYMVHTGSDGNSGREQLRSEGFSLVDALWAEDGSLALIIQVGTVGSGNSGPVMLAFSDGRQLIGLLDEAHQLRWGP